MVLRAMAANEAFEWTARVIAVHSSDVERAADALCAEPENVRIDHRRRQLVLCFNYFLPYSTRVEPGRLSR
jgi:hypothetical protein